MQKIINGIDKTLAYALMLAMAAILLVVSWQVFSRFILHAPSSSTEELSRFLLIWIGILGAAYAYRHKAHLGFDLLVEKLAPRGRRMMLSLVEVLVIFFVTMVMFYGGWELVQLTLELDQVSASLNVKIGYIYAVMPISGGLIVIFCLCNLFELWQHPVEGQH